MAPAKSKSSAAVLSTDDLLKTLADNREAIRAFGVRRIGLFGSRARGTPTDASDIDLVVEFEKKSFDGYMDLKMFLEELFGCPVDLVLADSIKPRLRKTILSETVHAPGL